MIPGAKDMKVDLSKAEATFENTQNISQEEIFKCNEEADYHVVE